MDSEKTPHTSSLRASYEASFRSSSKKRSREISNVHCILKTDLCPTLADIVMIVMSFIQQRPPAKSFHKFVEIASSSNRFHSEITWK